MLEIFNHLLKGQLGRIPSHTTVETKVSKSGLAAIKGAAKSIKGAYEFCLNTLVHQTKWLPPILDQMKKHMKKMLKLWGLCDASVKIYNEQIAISKGLIVSYNNKLV